MFCKFIERIRNYVRCLNLSKELTLNYDLNEEKYFKILGQELGRLLVIYYTKNKGCVKRNT